ncbi:ATP-binding cassette domain-containing protein [Streptomyces sp900105755]|uniref:ATP-binding cassette domain-containing protein n=1 Tax=Streptomyces sp. 900105755 TaxID=3154389 RepID=A0ABV1T6U2_9ACTN
MHGVPVTAERLGLEGPRGWAFRGISLDAGPGALIAVEGPSGSGRTCLLLALTGRMKATEGTAAVGTARLPKQLAAARRISAVANVAGVTDLEPALTVGEHLRERALLQRRFGDSLRDLVRPRAERRARAQRRVDDALAAAGLDLESLPKGARTAVRDLERIEALRLSVALALVGGPRLLAVDDTDLKLSESERAEVRTLLTSIAEAGTTVVAVCGEAMPGAVVVHTGNTENPENAETPENAANAGDAEAAGAAEETRTAKPSETAKTAKTAKASEDEEAGDALSATGRA